MASRWLFLAPLAFLVASSFVLSDPSEACPPPRKNTYDGCVVDGLFVGANGYSFTAMPEDKLDELEGRQVSVAGWAYSRGEFRPDMRTLKSGGACTLQDDSPAFHHGLVWANAHHARNLISDDELDLAEAHIERALELDRSFYELYLIRARVFLAMGHHRRAYASAKYALSLAEEDDEIETCESMLKEIP